MHLVSPPHFAVTVVSNCSRVLQSFQEKSRTKAMQNWGINKVHLWSLWKWWILTFQLQQRPDEQGWSASSFELICCYLFTRTEPVSSSWTNKNLLRLWWSQFGRIKYKETISWYWGRPQKGKKFFKLGIRRKQDRPARKKKRHSGAFLHLNTINNIFHIVSL